MANITGGYPGSLGAHGALAPSRGAGRSTMMRVTLRFVTPEGGPDLETPPALIQLSSSPTEGQLVNLNDTLFTVEEVEWNANPAPMRGEDLTIWLKPR